MNNTNLQPLIDEIIKNIFENELFELNKFFLENGLSIFKDVQKDINEIVYQMIVECVVDIYQSKREVYRKGLIFSLKKWKRHSFMMNFRQNILY